MQKRINLKLLSQPANRGKHLIFVSGRIFTARTAKEVRKILDRIHQDYPKKKVSLTYIPKADTLIEATA